MSIAEELAKKYRFAVNHGFGKAIDEALELAAQEALALADDESNVGIAERIRSLKSPAGPVQPSRAQEP